MCAQKNTGVDVEPQDHDHDHDRDHTPAPKSAINLQELNHTELRMLYYERFGKRVPYAIPRVSLIRSLEENEPLDAPDLVEAMRDNLVRLIGRYWNRARSQIPCNGICYLCPDGQVVDCYRDNQQLMDGGAAMAKTSLDPNDKTLTLEKIEADGTAIEDRVFLLRFCISNKWLEWGSKEMDESPAFLWALVQKKMGGNGKSKSKSKDKKKDKKGAKAKGKAKGGKKAKSKDEDEDKGNGVSKDPKFVLPPDIPAEAQERAAKAAKAEAEKQKTAVTPTAAKTDDRLNFFTDDFVKDIERARALTKKKAKPYMEKFETMAKEVSEIKETLDILGSMLQSISNSLSSSNEDEDED